MKTYLIALTSITYAMKAQKILKIMGYYCEIQRTPKNFSTGCGYSIRVKGDLSEYLMILKNNNIKYLNTMEMGADFG